MSLPISHANEIRPRASVRVDVLEHAILGPEARDERDVHPELLANDAQDVGDPGVADTAREQIGNRAART
jgi:hypothetical protein